MSRATLEISAVQEALKANWANAIELNKQIIKDSPDDIAALNRLAKAYKETGDPKKCAASYRKVLKLDKYNTIAIKNLKRLTQQKFQGSSASTSSSPRQSGNATYLFQAEEKPWASAHGSLFLEEPGKTKVVYLVNLAPASILSSVNPSDEVILALKRHTIQVTDMHNKYLGALPDDIARRLTTLIKGGNRYCAFVKSVSKKELAILIREIHKCPRFKNQPSFLTVKPTNTKSGGKENKQQFQELEDEEEPKVEEEDSNL